MRRTPRHPESLAIAGCLALLGACVGADPAAAAISGVCPDGSIFIVQSRAAIPCRAAKEVPPDEVPPLRPEYLPRPYRWQVYRESANPNNPYNLIDAARRVRELQGAPPAPQGAGSLPSEQRFGGATPPPRLPPVAAAPSPPALALSPDDVRDLFLIVELSQQHAPARFVKEDARGEATLEVSLAWSEAFDARFREVAPQTGGPVVLFTVLAHQPDAFHPNFTFVQGHETFRPRADDPTQMGLLEGQIGALPAEGVALGYVVLPARMDPGRDFHVYWNDRRIATLLRP